MERLTDTLGLRSQVLWLPAVLDVSAVYPALDVLCSASAFGEGFSNVLGEAQATGVPCVATSVGDAAEVLGNVGMVVPPRDPEALARALLTTIAARSPALAARCREHVVRQFGVERLLTSTAAALGLSDA
jgi:glycosyltransferase involved in cell wall biosynthesis